MLVFKVSNTASSSAAAAAPVALLLPVLAVPLPPAVAVPELPVVPLSVAWTAAAAARYCACWSGGSVASIAAVSVSTLLLVLKVVSGRGAADTAGSSTTARRKQHGAEHNA